MLAPRNFTGQDRYYHCFTHHSGVVALKTEEKRLFNVGERLRGAPGDYLAPIAYLTEYQVGEVSTEWGDLNNV